MQTISYLVFWRLSIRSNVFVALDQLTKKVRQNAHKYFICITITAWLCAVFEWVVALGRWKNTTFSHVKRIEWSFEWFRLPANSFSVHWMHFKCIWNKNNRMNQQTRMDSGSKVLKCIPFDLETLSKTKALNEFVGSSRKCRHNKPIEWVNIVPVPNKMTKLQSRESELRLRSVDFLSLRVLWSCAEVKFMKFVDLFGTKMVMNHFDVETKQEV